MNVKVLYIEEVSSTNDYLRNYKAPTGEDMTVVWTDFQSAGRGQGSNRWESERGKNLTFSVLTHPRKVPADRQYALSMAIALAVKEALCHFVEDITVKWPNDVYWKNQKISGTLIETSLQGNLIKNCIFGTGININQQNFKGDAPNPISLCQILGREIDRQEVMRLTIKALQQQLEIIDNGGIEMLHAAYLAALYRREGMHPYRDAKGLFMARIVGVQPDGHLVLERNNGTRSYYAFKEVQFVKD